MYLLTRSKGSPLVILGVPPVLSMDPLVSPTLVLGTR